MLHHHTLHYRLTLRLNHHTTQTLLHVPLDPKNQLTRLANKKYNTQEIGNIGKCPRYEAWLVAVGYGRVLGRLYFMLYIFHIVLRAIYVHVYTRETVYVSVGV